MWPNHQETADLVTFTEEILKGKLHFLCGDRNENIENLKQLYFQHFDEKISN